MNANDPLSLAWHLGLIVALAVFLGLAFEETYKSQDRTIPGGIRSFPMLALGGAMLYLIEPHYAAAFIAGLLAIAVWLRAGLKIARDPTMMIPSSNLIAYALGPMGLTQPTWLCVAVVTVAVLLLGWREQLHLLTRELPKDEVLTVGKFLILTGVILPLVPNTPVTSYVSITPYQVWLAVVAICSLSYAGYLIQKYVPFRDAALLPAVLGGIYSSTATTIVLAKQQRDAPAPRPELLAGIVAATAIMYVRIGIVIVLFDPALALTLAPALAGLFALGAVMAGVVFRGGAKTGAGLGLEPTNPLQIQLAVTFAVLFVVISVASVWAKNAFGAAGVFGLAAVVGVTDIDPYVINVAQGGIHGLGNQALAAAILIAASSNNVLKAGYTLGFGGAKARRAAILLGVLAVLGLGAAAFYIV
jgi:uncharacterized membrane protein (DUF4010 family)